MVSVHHHRVSDARISASDGLRTESRRKSARSGTRCLGETTAQEHSLVISPGQELFPDPRQEREWVAGGDQTQS